MPAVNLEAWQWLLLALGAFVTGLAKTGISGLGILSVALFANAMPARASTGALLPLLLCADVFGIAFFRKHVSWPHLWKLFPGVVPGVIAGYFAMDRVSNSQVQHGIAVILLALVALHWWRKYRADPLNETLPHSWWFAAFTGMLAGFTTMVANAAGPVMMLYLLALGLPKLNFVGTGAWFFMLVNAFKVPFSLKLGLINAHTLVMDALLVVPMVPGALLGPVFLKHINQGAFEWMVMALTVAGSLRLLF